MLTLRWFGLALLLPALLLLAGAIPALALPALVYGVGLLALTWLDRRAAGTVRQFRLTRQHDHKLSLGVRNPVTLHIESLVAHPSTMTHASMTPEARCEAGISDRLIRLSVGIEHPADLVNDIRGALDRAWDSRGVRRVALVS